MGVPTGAVPKTAAVLPAADCSSAPTAAPLVIDTGVADATCAGVAARSNAVSQSCDALDWLAGRTSTRHILFYVDESDEKRSVTVVLAPAGRMVIIAPENWPLVTSKRRSPGPGEVTSTGLAGKWNAR